MEHSILFVDDEVEILNSLKRIYRKSSFKVHTANSGEEGLSILKDEPMSVIVSDMQMPGMDGATFLSKAMQLNSNATRLILSGHADYNRVMDAINQGKIWSFIAKPWKESDFSHVINNAVSVFEEKVTKQNLLDQLKEKNELLEGMNHKLEDKVQERTSELRLQADISRMMVESDNYANSLDTFCERAQELFGFKYIKISNQSSKGQTHTTIPIKKRNRTLGFLEILSEHHSPAEIQQKIDGFIPLLALAISMKRLAKDSDNFISDIDNILENI